MNKIPAQLGIKLPNVLLLPPPHHRRWGWLIWTIILIALLFLLLWLLRGCKPAAVPVAQEDNRAYYGKFELLENSPTMPSSPTASAATSSYYHRTLPNGKILFVTTDNIPVDIDKTSMAGSGMTASKGAYRVFTFDPATNQFQDAPIQLEDEWLLDSHIVTNSGQLAVLNLDLPPIFQEAISQPGGVNLRLDLYDPTTGEKTEVKPADPKDSTANFAREPYIFEVEGGLLIGAVEYTKYYYRQATEWQAVTFFYDFATKQLTKKVGSIGLPDINEWHYNPIVPLTADKALIFDQAGGNQTLYLFDYRTKTVSFKRQLSRYNPKLATLPRITARLIPNTSLVYIVVGSKDPSASSSSVVYLYNFENNALYTYRLGNKPLQQGTTKDISDALEGGIPREGTAEGQELEVEPNSFNKYWLQPLLDGTVLITGYRYQDLPWSFGLFGTLDNEWLARANPIDSESTDSTNNYADKLSSMSDIPPYMAYGSTIQDSLLLPDGRVLFAGPLWFIYTPDSSKTAKQQVNPTTYASRIAQPGHWTDGGKLLLGKAETTGLAGSDSPANEDYRNIFGTAYPLKDGRIFFLNPQCEAASYPPRGNNTVVADNVLGQIYNPSTGTSRWVKSDLIKGKSCLLGTRTDAYGFSRNFGVTDAAGNFHLLNVLASNNPYDYQELIYYPGSGKIKFKKLTNPTLAKSEKVDTDYQYILSGTPVAVGDKIYFFKTTQIGVLNVKTSQYYDLATKREFDWRKQHPNAKATAEQIAQWSSGIPKFNNIAPLKELPRVPDVGAADNQGIAAALYLGNSRILLTNTNQIQIFNIKTGTTEDLGTFKNITKAWKLFRLSNGRVVAVGNPKLPIEGNYPGSFPNINGEFPGTAVIDVEVINLTAKNVSETKADVQPTAPQKAAVELPVWILPNDRLLFASQNGNATRLSIYDLKQGRWLTTPSPLTDSLYDLSPGHIMQLPTHPMLIKLASKSQYIDYTKAMAKMSEDSPILPNATLLPINAIELLIPETGPWGYYDAAVSHFNWWLWWLTLQLVQAFCGLVVILTWVFKRKFITPL